jgi:regulator of protease activity HflC (stomatin/prohibitin superfamily)
MFWFTLIAAVFFLAFAEFLAALAASRQPRLTALGFRVIGGALLLLSLVFPSIVVIDADAVGQLRRVYLGRSMPPGRIIALPGENGPQAEILGPGLHVRPLLKLLYEVEETKVVDIPPNSYGLVTAKDGRPLADGQFLARGWPDAEYEKMLDAEYFLTHGGQKGPQLSVLRPGKYRLNHYLFDVRIKPALDVQTGEVAVIKSNVEERSDCAPALVKPDTARDDDELAVPLARKGCVGVWDEPLLPNRYYLNELAYTPTLVPSRVQTWSYKGGYTRRKIDLTVTQEGKIQQREIDPVDVPVPPDAADGAVILTVEGWRVPLELRALVQVEPEDAPKVVASVGSLVEIEDKIITPVIRSVIRNETGRVDDPARGIKGWKVMDLITQRTELEKVIESVIIPEGRKAGVTIKEVRFADPIIPPEFLLALQRQQLAEQLRLTYNQEKLAQDERIQTEKARATADQQDELIRAEIAVQVAEQTKQKLQKEGEGEKLRLTQIAEGQEAQAKVLGQDRVLQLAMLKEILAAAKENPELVKVPTVLVQGAEAGGLSGAAAVLGASNIVQWTQKGKTPGEIREHGLPANTPR